MTRVFAAAVFAVLATAPPLAAQTATRDLSVMPAPPTIPPAPPKLPIDYFPKATNSAGLSLALAPGEAVALGSTIKFRITSAKPGWLILLDARDDGRVVQLFPSVCTPASRQIRATAPLTLPDATFGCVFRASEPGTGQILAFVTEENIPLDDLLAKTRDLSAIPAPDAYLTDLARRLLTEWNDNGRNRPTRWSLVSARYAIK